MNFELYFNIMFIGKVKSPVVSTVKHLSYTSRKLLLIRKVHPMTHEEYGETIIAVDFVDAGEGDIVLVSQEGGSARKILDDKTAPVRSFILGIVDNWEIEKMED